MWALWLVSALGLGVAVWALLFRSAVGFRLRAVGLSPRAAGFAGISPERYALGTLAFAGALAGLGGAFEVAGVTGQLYEGLSPGHGYTAIAVALLARLHPGGVVVAALLFGALAAGAGAMQRVAGVPAVFVSVVQAVTVFTVLALEAVYARRARIRAGSTTSAEPGEGA